VGIATNNSFVLAGAPASDRLVSGNPFSDIGDDVGAVISYRVTNGSLNFHQVFAADTDLNVLSSGFGNVIAMDGNLAAIPYVDNAGSNKIQIWEYNSFNDVWARSFTLDGGFIVDIDRSSVIARRNSQTVIYRRDRTLTWSESAVFNINPIAVTIDGTTATATDSSGVVHVLRQNASDVWSVLTQIPTSARSSVVSASANKTSPSHTTVELVSFRIAATDETNDDPYLLFRFPNQANTRIDFPDDQPVNTVLAINRTLEIPDGQAYLFDFVEEDDPRFSADDDIGRFTVDSLGRVTHDTDGTTRVATSTSVQDIQRGSTVDTVSTFTIPVNRGSGTGNYVVTLRVIQSRDSDSINSIPTDIADSLGDFIAIGIPSQNRVETYGESEKQVGWFSSPSDGEISDLLVHPDGSVIYATGRNGVLRVLENPTFVNPQDPQSLKLFSLDQFASPTVTSLNGASSLAFNHDQSRLFVTAENSDAVTVFDVDEFGFLGSRTNLPADSQSNLDGANASANQTFGPQQFVIIANSSDSSLTAFSIVDDTGKIEYVTSQARNANGVRGLGDEDPLDSVTRVQSLTRNPIASTLTDVNQVFYMVAPNENAIFALSRVEQTDGSFQTLVKQRLNDDERIASQPNVLAGAADIVVSPDGKFIYVAATREGATGQIAIFDRNVTAVDGLQFNDSVPTLVFDPSVDFNDPGANSVATLVLSPDGKQLYASGPKGLQVFTRNQTTGGLTALQSLPEFTLVDIKFLGDKLVYAVDPANDKLITFDRAADGKLTKGKETITRDNPRSVEIGPAISGFPETRVSFATSAIDTATRTVTTSTAHGLVTGQEVSFTSAKDTPGGATVGVNYFARKIDDTKFQLFTSAAAAIANTASALVPLSPAGNTTATFDVSSPAGLDDFVDVADDAKLRPTGAFSVEAWINPANGIDDNMAGFPTVLAKTTFGDGYGMYYANGNIFFYMDDFIFTTVFAPISKNVFSHVVATFDGTRLRLYVNGVLATNTATVPTAFVHSDGPLRIGNAAGGPFLSWLGSIGEVAIYPTALTQARVTAHFSSLTSTKSSGALADNPIVYYKLDESTGTTAKDSSTNQLDGTYSSGVELAGFELRAGLPPGADPGIPEGRFIYVASATTSSIAIYDEFATGDSVIDGNLRLRQIVREGVRGVRGLQGVTTLQMSAAIADAVLAFGEDAIDADNDQISTERPHRLLTGQLIRFTSADDLPSGAEINTNYFVRKLDANKFQLFKSANDGKSGGTTGLLDLTTAANTAGGTYVLHTTTPAGAYVYALGRDANAISVFERDIDPESPTVGQLNFLQVIRNRVGNQTSGANFGLFQPNSIVAPTDDTSTVYVGSGFDNLISGAPGGFVEFRNNPHDSTALPPVELFVDFANFASLDITTGRGEDLITVFETPDSGMGDDGAASSAAPIPVSFNTGAGQDGLTLNDAAGLGDFMITGDLGSGDDQLMVRTEDNVSSSRNARTFARTVGAPAEIRINTGTGADTIMVQSLSSNSILDIDTGDGATDEADQIIVVGQGLASGSNVEFATGTNDIYDFDIENFGSNPDLANGEPGTLQLGSEFGIATLMVGGTPTNVTFQPGTPAPRLEAIALVASLDAPDTQAKEIVINEGTGIKLDVSQSVLVGTAPVTYAWDFNGDGFFTELTTQDEIQELSWEELKELGLNNTSGTPSVTRRLGVRVTQGTSISDDEVSITIIGGTADVQVIGSRTHLARVDVPYRLDLSGSNANGDPIVSWQVNWGDGQTETFAANVVASHFYQRPGDFAITVTGTDANGNETVRNGVTDPTTSTNSPTVRVTFNAGSLSARGNYTTAEGQGITLSGIAAGTPVANSFAWIINGNRKASPSATLTLTWAELNALGITNDGSFDVQLEAAYLSNTNATVGPLRSAVAKLIVTNVKPTATFINSGPINQGDAATVSFININEPVPSELVFKYDFGTGNGFVVGSEVQPVPAGLPAGSRVIRAQIDDGSGPIAFTTTLVIADRTPTLRINDNERGLVGASEGALATLGGTFQNPGNGPVVFTANIGTVTQDPVAKTWLWKHTALNSSPTRIPITVTIADAENNKSSVSFELLVTNVAPSAVLTLPAAVKAQGVLTLAVNPTNGDSLTIGTRTYTFAASPATGASGRVLIGATLALTQANLVKAIAGTDTFNSAHPLVTLGDFVANRAAITAKVAGTTGNTIATSETFKAPENFFDSGSLGFAAPGADVLEGATNVNVRFVNPRDPSPEDTTAGFTYAYDFGDGFVPGTAIQAIPRKLLVDDGEYPIRGRIIDKDGGFSEQTVVLTVANAVATLGAITVTPAQARINETVTVSGSFSTDPGVNDTHTIRISWGDGKVDMLSAPSAFGIPNGGVGTGYTNATEVAVTGGSGTGMTINITTTNGAITGAVISKFGQGYLRGDIINVPRGTAAGNAQLTLLFLGKFDQASRTFSAAHTYRAIPQVPGAATYAIEVTVADDEGGSRSTTKTVNFISDGPRITTAAAVSVPENQTAVIDINSVDSDGGREGAGLTYALTGGADVAKFAINPNTGVLTFKAAPNREEPGRSTLYNVVVTVTNARAKSSSQSLAVTVTNVNETPQITNGGGGECCQWTTACGRRAVDGSRW
jgi:6-phosphogluconolactonase (cycloisomerase 2 family)